MQLCSVSLSCNPNEFIRKKEIRVFSATSQVKIVQISHQVLSLQSQVSSQVKLPTSNLTMYNQVASPPAKQGLEADSSQSQGLEFLSLSY